MGIEEYTVYDEVLEYLLGEGYSEEESNQIMVDFVIEGGLSSGIVKGLGALAKFVQKRASTPLKTAATDVATTALSLGGTPTGAKLSTTAAKVASPSPIVRTVKAPTARTAPKGANVAPDPWKQPSAPRSSAKPSTSPARTPSTPKALTGSPTPRALTGTQARPALPSGAKGGALAKTTPGGALVSTRASRGVKPTLKPQALPKPKPTAEPGGALVSTRAPKGAKPTLNRQALPQPKPTAEPGGALVSTRAPKGAKPASASTPKAQVRSQQFQDVQRLNKMTGGGIIGELPKASTSKPAPAPKPSAAATAKAMPKPTTVKPKASVKPSSTGSGSAGTVSRGLKNVLKTGLGAGVAGVAVDMAFPRSTAPGTRDTAPKMPTSAKEVKKGETYYDPSTRVGDSQRFAQRKKVGQKIVGPGKVGTEAQSFDKAYGAAKTKGGKGSTFKWKGKDYKVS